MRIIFTIIISNSKLDTYLNHRIMKNGIDLIVSINCVYLCVRVCGPEAPWDGEVTTKRAFGGQVEVEAYTFPTFFAGSIPVVFITR